MAENEEQFGAIRIRQGVPDYVQAEWDKKAQEGKNSDPGPGGSDGGGSGVGVAFIIFVAVLWAISYILPPVFKAVSTGFNYVEHLVMTHWLISSLFFLYLLRQVIIKRVHLLLKFVGVVVCCYGLFSAYAGYRMQSVIERWQGDYSLIDKQSEIKTSASNTKPKKGKRSKKAKKVEPLDDIPTTLENAKSFYLSPNGELSLSGINKKYIVEPYDYIKYWHYLFENGDGSRPETIDATWKDLNAGKTYPEFYMAMHSDTLELLWRDPNHWYRGLYLKKKATERTD